MTQPVLPGLEEITEYHEFKKSLQVANVNSLRLGVFYKSSFPNVKHVHKVSSLQLQRQGIDTILELQNGKEIYFDEKIRQKDYGDILLEEYSIWPFYDWDRYDEYRTERILPLDPRQDGLETVFVDNRDVVPDGYEEFLVKGWINGEKLTDYIAYIIKPSKRVYFLPFLLLQRAWENHYEAWLNLYKRYWARNRSYVTTNIPIPTDTLFKAFYEAGEWAA